MSFITSLLDSVECYSSYPRNLFAAPLNEYSVQALEDQLDRRTERLFDDGSNACVDVWDLPEAAADHHYTCIDNVTKLEEHLLGPASRHQQDPYCRFVYIHSPHSREKLRISRAMFMQLMTYHQVMPTFLEQIFPFGRQHYREDLHIGGYRNESRIDLADRLPDVPELGRSGRHVELSYSLKSIEASQDAYDPWSIRQCSVYHQFDLEEERSVWIVVKGNDLMREMIETRVKAVNAKDPKMQTTQTAISRALQFALATHLEFCKWSAENWHWYLNTLENSVQEKTRRTLSTRIDAMKPWTPLSPSVKQTQVHDKKRRWYQKEVPPLRTTDLPLPVTEKLTLSPTIVTSPASNAPVMLPYRSIQQPTFSFRDLQDVQTVEEKANDALLILTSNSNVLNQLKSEYKTLLESEDCPKDLIHECRPSLRRFERIINGIDNEFALLRSRVQNLQRLLQERKGLIYLILQYRNMIASQELAERAQQSAQNMEVMTNDMHTIAKKTKDDTVSMKIITVVTLFFLPGTFISTIMNTPIVTFSGDDSSISDRNIGIGALEFYVAVSLPLMCATFAAWFGVSWWEKRGDRKRSALHASSKVAALAA